MTGVGGGGLVRPANFLTSGYTQRAARPPRPRLQLSQLHINNMNNTYNGWRNHATWAIGLHLMDTVTGWIIDDPESWGKANDLEAAAGLFRDLVDEQVEMAGLDSFSLLMDLLDTGDVDWYSLGRSALEAAEVPSLVSA